MVKGKTYSPKQLSKKSRKFRSRYGYDRKLCYVYGLRDGFGKIRYVGQTRLDLESRLRWHFRAARTNKTPLHKWINGSFGIEIFMIDSNATWDVSEILWIAHYRSEGHDLVNVLRGGQDTLSAIQREKSKQRKAALCPDETRSTVKMKKAWED
jgi:hypothetical protein